MNFVNKRLNNLAFTLAEFLIILGIVGIIVIVTIPLLNTQSEQIKNVTAWKKAYGTILQAQNNIINENGGDLSLGFISNMTPNDFLDGWVPYFQVVKKCYNNRVIIDGCYKGTFNALDNTAMTNYANSTAALTLSDGSVLFFYRGMNSYLSSDSHIFVDVNGSNLPNTLGKDIFVIRYDTTKKLFLAVQGASCGGGTTGSSNSIGWYCGAYYLYN